MHGQRKQPHSRPLPVCADGLAPGRWVFHHSLYPDVPGEPLEWRPYGCHYRRFSGDMLKQCLARLGVTQLLGESTLGQIHDSMHVHINGSGYYWPYHWPMEHPVLLRAEQRELRGSELHGMSVMGTDGLNELRNNNPHTLVMLQGANDPARDTLPRFEQRLGDFLRSVRADLDRGDLTTRRTVWITAPTRHYKARALPCGAAPPRQAARPAPLLSCAVAQRPAPRSGPCGSRLCSCAAGGQG